MNRSAKHLYWRYRELGSEVLLDLIPFTPLGDALWCRLKYRHAFGRFPRLRHPTRLSEHLLRMKLSPDGDSAPRVAVTDKAALKDYVTARLGPGNVPETFALLETLDEALAFEYPATCVVKPTHLSAQFILREDARPAVDASVLGRWFAQNYYHVGREPNYRALRPRVIVEERLVQEGRATPDDYKIFCFHGEPVLIEVDRDRATAHIRSFYSLDWALQPFTMGYPPIPEPVARPECLDDMLDIARSMSEGFPFMRVDLYVIGRRILVGELTSYPRNCHMVFEPDDVDVALGRLFEDGPSRTARSVA